MHRRPHDLLLLHLLCDLQIFNLLLGHAIEVVLLLQAGHHLLGSHLLLLLLLKGSHLSAFSILGFIYLIDLLLLGRYLRVSHLEKHLSEKTLVFTTLLPQIFNDFKIHLRKHLLRFDTTKNRNEELEIGRRFSLTLGGCCLRVALLRVLGRRMRPLL
jgi:hypothetical protein